MHWMGESEIATAASQLEDQHQWRKRDHVKNSDWAAASVRFSTGAAVTSFIWQNVLCFHYLEPDCLAHRGVKSTEKLYWGMSTVSKIYSIYPKTYLSESTKVCTCNCTWYLKVNYFLALEIKSRDCFFFKRNIAKQPKLCRATCLVIFFNVLRIWLNTIYKKSVLLNFKSSRNWCCWHNYSCLYHRYFII